jgi:lipoprotein-anchoring transpeptidase ErfK/SrfK
MKRVLKQTKRNETLASTTTKTMKTSRTLTLVATLGLAALLSTPAFADFSSNNSKHGFPQPRSHYIAAVDLGKFTWLAPDASVNRIIVSLADQSLYAYNGQQLVAYSTISSGKPGHETPTGTFTVSQKDVDHHSSLYDDASMPYFMRLTDGGVGLHAGFDPGYPASHGCVRLPMGMAQELFQHVDEGTPVQIVGGSTNSVTQSTTTPAGVPLAQN